MQEIQYSGNEVRTVVATTDPEAPALFSPVEALFPWASLTDYKSVSTAAFHEVLAEAVVTCVLPSAQSQFLLPPEFGVACRKFCLGSRTSYLRGYKIYEGAHLSWAPSSARILGYGVNMKEFGRPAPARVNGFEDFYFSGNPEEIEEFFKLPRRRGIYETFYSVTLVGGAVTRCKQYVYDEQTANSDWDVLYWAHKKQMDTAA